MLDIFISIIGIILTILIIVGVHEFSHFIVARMMGIKVLRFSIGFGKTLFSWNDKKGTEYVIAAIPLGGYVKMLDESEEAVPPEELHLAYNRQPIYKRIAVIVAGPLSNIVLAFALYWLLFVIGFNSVAPMIGQVAPHSIAANAGVKPNEEIISINNQPTYSWMNVLIRLMGYIGSQKEIQIETRDIHSQQTHRYYLDLTNWHLDDLKPDPLGSLGIQAFEPTIPPIIGKIQLDSAAEKARLQVGDRIISIDNKPIKTWVDIMQIVATHPGKTLIFTLQRDGKTLSTSVTVGYKHNLFFKKQGLMGFSPQFKYPEELLRKTQYGVLSAIPQALQYTNDYVSLNFQLLGKLVTGKVSLQSLGGPITIFESAGTALNTGIAPFISFLAFLSIAIGVINILPIPGLDGGHLLFYFIEFVIRRPLSQNFQLLLFRFGMIFLFLLLVQALVNDIMRM